MTPSYRCTACGKAVTARKEHLVLAGLLHCRTCFDVHELESIKHGNLDRGGYVSAYGRGGSS